MKKTKSQRGSKPKFKAGTELTGAVKNTTRPKYIVKPGPDLSQKIK